MGFQLNRSSKEPMSEINVTPFVDVMLVLLIIFMVTAPLLTVGVQVDLPESAADSLPDDQEPLTLSINSKGEVFIQEHQVEFDKIVAKILRCINLVARQIIVASTWKVVADTRFNLKPVWYNLVENLAIPDVFDIELSSANFFTFASIV